MASDSRNRSGSCHEIGDPISRIGATRSYRFAVRAVLLAVATLGFGGLVGDIVGLGQGDSVATIDATGDWRNASKKARTAFFEPSNSTRPLRWASASEEWPR